LEKIRPLSIEGIFIRQNCSDARCLPIFFSERLDFYREARRFYREGFFFKMTFNEFEGQLNKLGDKQGSVDKINAKE
jgi:hypothetical protein